MPIAVLPPEAKIVELRLGIDVPSDDVRRPLTLKAPYSAPFRDLWSGEMLFAPMLPATVRKVVAFFESLDGRVNPFSFTLTAGKFGQVAAFTGTLASVPAYGAVSLSVAMSPTTGTLKAGTLITVGDIETETFQMFEVTEDTTVAATTSVPIAPRVRQLFSSGGTVTFGSVSGKFRLAEDDFDSNVAVSNGTVSVKIIEAL